MAVLGDAAAYQASQRRLRVGQNRASASISSDIYTFCSHINASAM